MPDQRPGSLFEYFEKGRQRPPNPLGLWVAAGLAAGTVVAAATGEVGLWVGIGLIAGLAAGYWNKNRRRTRGE